MARQNGKQQARTAAEARRFESTAIAGPYGGTDHPLRNVDTIALLHRRRMIDDTELQAAARYRHAVETVPDSFTGTLGRDHAGHTAPHSRIPAARQLLAAQILREAKLLLGELDGGVVRLVCGQGYTIGEAARRFYGETSRRQDEKHIGMRLRESLALLSMHWFGTAKAPRRAHASMEPDAVPTSGQSGSIDHDQLAGQVVHADRRGWTR